MQPPPSSAQGESELSPGPQGPTPSVPTPLCPQILPLCLLLTLLWPHGSCSPNTPETFPPQGLCTPPWPSPKISARFPPSLEFLEMACVPLPKLTATLRVGLLCDPGFLANRGGVGPSRCQGPHITFQGYAPRRVSRRLQPHPRKQGHVLPACLGTPGDVGSTRGGEPLSASKQLLTNCSGSPGSFGVYAASREGGGWGGAGGCPPGITQPIAMPTAGTGAWHCAWKPGSRDERLGGESVKSVESSTGTSCYRLRWLPRRGLQRREGVGRGFGHGRAHPFPGSSRTMPVNSIPAHP